ncbi:MAG: hypothetical protein IPJ89_00665 [Candidatus Iainarchaeum archaeon]|uniref:Uncharacterized protein n=1 Tax=Candidatus Iainarchaeum sp. TaxID=3101447 RepID=A0A7T9DK61_9ARCH|nr:MAG: hypothetical protein IPJ89_00665 [Candidatus Diapherotrites archaeon]
MPRKKTIRQRPITKKTPGLTAKPTREDTWLETILNRRLQKKGMEPTIFPIALAQIGITPARAKALIAWQVKRMQFEPARVQNIIRELIHVYENERNWLIKKRNLER